ncbi:outer membrane protein [Hymenobacter arizonensis]|uniref:Outer membrane protein beta-barrel domain-containing protein n=1 Tax=Hymenobacter arizonensis TaxID=1227077 RepID=A0A1I5SJH7_HYMAR|nr:outer membrane beta-barrel protein [Hymenobacter arizonensis]SFP70657.1 Outer membrane protein beta-barrel domain-containing protein [Hymenobacter arizonensis]
MPSTRLVAFLLALPMLSRAQTPVLEPAPTPKFYVGLAAYSSYYQNFGGKAARNSSVRLPVQLTAGYQLGPRISLQVGVAHSRANYSYDNEFIYYPEPNNAPQYSRFQGSIRSQVTSVSLLSRYTLTRNLAHRVQFDALAGAGLENGSGNSRSTRSDSIAGGLQITNYSSRGSRNLFLLTLGAGVRYRLNPRLDLNFDITTNRSVGDPYYNVGFTGSAALGVRYRFGK